jgi:hypothetical protein
MREKRKTENYVGNNTDSTGQNGHFRTLYAVIIVNKFESFKIFYILVFLMKPVNLQCTSFKCNAVMFLLD